VVALLGDIAIYPMGAKCYELVPSIVLSSAPMSWNNSPVLVDHPTEIDYDGGGEESGACTPAILSRDQFGCVFNSRYDDDSQSLQMEAWLNPKRANLVGQDAIDVFDRCANGEVLEISVGAYIRLVQSHGMARNGVEYDLAWTLIHPDHLAIGLRGKEGACSIDEGCGANRYLKNADGTYKYSSTQIDLPESVAASIVEFGKSIPDDRIVESEGGREPNPHVTIKYGLHDLVPDNLIALLEREGTTSISLILGDLAIFEADSYDVLYTEVISPDLMKLNTLITGELGVTDTQPVYIPHVTIAYVVKGIAQEYIGNSSLTGKQITASDITFSSIDGSTTIISLPAGKEDNEMAMPTQIAASGKPAADPAKSVVKPLLIKPVKRKVSSAGLVTQIMKSIRSLVSSTDQAEEAAELLGYQVIKSMTASAKSSLSEIDTLADSLIVDEIESPTETIDGEIAEEIMEDARLQAIRSHCFAALSSISGILDQASSMRGFYGYSAGDSANLAKRDNAGKRNSKKDQLELQKAHDHLVSAGAECASPKNMSSGAQKSPCACDTILNASQSKEDDAMAIEKDKMRALVGRLLSGKGTPEDAVLIKAEWGIEAPAPVTPVTASATTAATTPVQPANLAASPAAKVKTDDELEKEYLAAAPPSVRNMVERAKSAEAEARAGMIRQLVGAQTHYDEKALTAMPTDGLAGLIRVLRLDDPPARINYLGMGLPNPGGADEDAKALKVFGEPPSGIAEYAAASNGIKPEAKAN
jgi:2'-5' RNA ligase